MAAAPTTSFDEAARLCHRSRPFRVGLIVATGLSCLLLATPALCAAWALVGLAIEVWGYASTRRQHRHRAVSHATQLSFAGSIAAQTLNWVVLAALLWRTGTLPGQLCGAVMLSTVFALVLLLVLQTPLAFLIAGAAPPVAAVLVVTLEQRLVSAAFLPAALALILPLAFAVRRARQTPSALAAQRRLEISEAQYRVMSENISEVIARTGLDGKRIYLSPQAHALTGYSDAEVQANGLLSFMHHEDRERVQAVSAQVAEDGIAARVEFRMVTKSGDVLWVESSLSRAAVNGPDQPMEVISVSRDISGRKALEFELIAAKEQAEAASRAKSDFLANMSHELRTPLNAIVGFSTLLRDAEGMSPAHARHAALVADGGTALLAVVNSVLDFSRLEAQAVELAPAPFDPAQTVRSIADLLGLQAAEKGIALRVEAASAGGPLVGDAPLVRQVTLNLLGNALKFTERGEVVVSVAAQEAGALTRLRVEVADTGIGMSPAQLDRAFERFVQADGSISRRFGGAGLGLAICQRIVDLMGGRIGARSVEGQGSTFWFELDLPRAVEAPPAASPEPEEAATRRLRALVVDDVAVNRELVSALLSPFDIEIAMAADGAEALDAAQREAFDVILMDVQMPVMDGLAATRAIRRLENPDRAATPIVALSANVLPEQVKRCLEAGMDAHLGKPINTTRLLEVLDRVVGAQPPQCSLAAAS